jgi:hypothetical protein
MGTKIRVDVKTHVWHNNDGDDSDELYSHQGTTDEDHNLLGLIPVEDGQYFDMIVPFDLVAGEDYFLVYGIYSTGDSFSNQNGKLELVDVYTTREKADRCVKSICEHNALSATPHMKKKGKNRQYDEHGVQLKNDAGVKYKFGVPWTGYFESLQDVNIEVLQLAEK